MRNNINNLLIQENDTINKALIKISNNKLGIVFIQNSKNIVIACSTDGDIRDGLLRGIKLNDFISTCFNKNFVYCDELTTREEIIKKFDSNIKSYPTTVGSQKFEPIVVDKSDSLKVNKHFQSRFEELRGEYDKLVEEYNWTSLVYGSRYTFQPTIGDTYHLYKGDDLFLSIIEPHQWDKEHVGSFKLLTNGKWDKV